MQEWSVPAPGCAVSLAVKYILPTNGIDEKGRLSKPSFEKEERVSVFKESKRAQFFESRQVWHLSQIPVSQWT